MSSTSSSRNEIVLLPIPFSDLKSRKVRPAIVVGVNGHGDLFLVPITSKFDNVDLPLRDWKAAGLNVPCGIKAQLATVEKRLVLRVLGRLTAEDQQLMDAELKRWLSL